MSALRTLLSPALSGALLLTVPLTFFGTGCRDLDKAYEAYCETADCDGGTPDGGEDPSVVLTVAIPGEYDVAVRGECINGWITTPPGQPVTLRQSSQSLAENPGSGARSAQTLFGGADCAQAAVTDLEVEAGVAEQPVSFRAYTEDPEDGEHVIEAKMGEEGEWRTVASFEVEPGRISFGEREEGTPYDDMAAIPSFKLDVGGCTYLKGQLYGERSGREALLAPGKLSLRRDDAPSVEGPSLGLEADCLGEQYSVEQLLSGEGPEIAGGAQVEISLEAPAGFSGCHPWKLYFDGAVEGRFQVYNPNDGVCP